MNLTQKPLSIAVLGHLHHPLREPFEGGLEAHTARVCQELARRGHQVTLYAKQGSDLGTDRVRVVPVMPAGFHFGHSSTPGDTERLDEATREACRRARGHDVVLNNTLNPVPYRELPDAAMLTVLHTPDTLERINRVLDDPSWRPGPRHRWVSVSHANAVGWRQRLAARDGRPGAAVEVVHNGIDLAAFPARLEATAQPPHLVWCARITPEKGLPVAMDAALAAGVPLRIAGPVSDPEHHRREVEPRLAAHPSLQYVGHLDHAGLAGLLAGAGAFLCTPQWDEPFGLAPLEAMACGTPVATLARGALPELVGSTGGVAAGAAEELPDAIHAALHLDRRGVRARAEQFSMAAMVDRYERILQELAAQPPSSPR